MFLQQLKYIITFNPGQRSFNTSPNKMCFWCHADDKDVPYTDHTPAADWRRVQVERPWSTYSPLHDVAGASRENILAKDIFHLCSLGAVRTWCVNLIAYLAWLGVFVACPYFLKILFPHVFTTFVIVFLGGCI